MRIGILGGGQLAMMMVSSAHKKYDIDFLVVDPADNPPASKYAKCIKMEYTDPKVLKLLSEECDVVTIDFENVPSNTLLELQKFIKVHPNPRAVEICQDRLNEKTLFVENNIPTNEFFSIDSEKDLKHSIKELGCDSILKSRRFGYDGKNQIIVGDKSIKQVWKGIGEVPSILEKKIDFLTEVSLIGVRLESGETHFYPLVQNFHKDGILSISIVPYKNSELQQQAEAIHKKITELLNYVGVLVIEFFLTKNFQLLVNEMAPRVHNSGHWTIEGANLSQFEAHIRAISGMNIDNIETQGCAAMINLISKLPKKDVLNLDDEMYFYDYGKSEREKRKLGHITIIDNDVKKIHTKLNNLNKKII
ncbi:MAG: 5-(carboxyamino)imidazole ribonucleotide synthase [Pseudomonadota bacterium]|nr:5-(carboxyamino)imidazole ribonucleotide synthase [Pseudomonadota bacterium]|tara:strand:- start:5171 stop:6256 length:1086 start_codon:yes stop_codon:yes gene_type:complete